MLHRRPAAVPRSLTGGFQASWGTDPESWRRNRSFQPEPAALFQAGSGSSAQPKVPYSSVLGDLFLARYKRPIGLWKAPDASLRLPVSGFEFAIS